MTSKSYDKADRIQTSETTNGTINGYVATYDRDAVGNQLRTEEVRYPIANGANDDKARTLLFKYDDIYRLTEESDNVTGSVIETIYNYDLQIDCLYRKSKANENDHDIWTYETDILNRTTEVFGDLVGVGVTESYSYKYDLNGNREERTPLTKIVSAQLIITQYDRRKPLDFSFRFRS